MPALRLIILALMIVGAIWLLSLLRQSQADKLNQQAVDALRAGRYAEAEEKSLRVISIRGGDSGAYLIAGEAAARLGRFAESAEFYRSGAECESRSAEKSRFLFYAAESSLQCGRLADAESFYRSVLTTDPGQHLAEDRLEFVLRTEGRTSESVAILAKRVAANEASFEQLLNYGHPDRQRRLPEQFVQYLPQLTRDGLPRLAMAKEALFDRKRDIARDHLRSVIRDYPACCDAQAELGRLVLDDGNEPFRLWFTELPPDCRESAGIWFLRGLWAERNGLWPEATGGFLRCLESDPTNREAVFHLSLALGETGLVEAAELCRDRARIFEAIERKLDEIHDEKDLLNNVARVIVMLGSVGRTDEAVNWLRLAGSRFGNVSELTTARDQAANGTRNAGQWDALIKELMARQFPPPVPGPRTDSISKVDRPSTRSELSFEIVAAESGLRFQFENADRRQSSNSGQTQEIADHRRMVQSNGGGIGTLDLDHDGWPDLYFTQGGSYPAETTSGPGDSIFRNLRGRQFADVAESANVSDREFGQGVCTSDFDSDGFADIFVANVGPNRLLRNNGDGTFTDQTADCGLIDNEWSTSCAMADFNDDGHPDLYVVNYLSLADASAEICHEGTKLRSCRPEGFVAADDRLWLSDGAGGFADISDDCGVRQPEGRGLGLVIADFDGKQSLDIFVGNDAVPNFLFLNQIRSGPPANSPANPQFEEAAVHRGIATDGAGLSQACMGVAFADFNLDQRDDVFVTNFYNEPNTLYLGQAAGMFADRTQSVRLAAPSLATLGFGTQAVDADLDGDEDLVVLNGHLDDLSAAGVPYQMRPQLFENLAGESFAESDPDSSFFQQPHLGRALARLDWNRDGRDDLAAGLLGEPSVVLSNTSPSRSPWLGIRLIGTSAVREPIGSIVTVKCGDRSLRKQLSTGSGFQAANQNRMSFALPSADENQLLEVHVRWPDASEATYSIPQLNHDYVLIQSLGRGLRIED